MASTTDSRRRFISITYRYRGFDPGSRSTGCRPANPLLYMPEVTAPRPMAGVIAEDEPTIGARPPKLYVGRLYVTLGLNPSLILAVNVKSTDATTCRPHKMLP